MAVRVNLAEKWAKAGPRVRADDSLRNGIVAVTQLDNVGIVVDDLESTIDFFRELGLELEGRATIDGEWAGPVTGPGQSVR